MDFKFDIPLQIQVVFYNLYFFTIKYSIARYKLESSVSMILRVDFFNSLSDCFNHHATCRQDFHAFF